MKGREGFKITIIGAGKLATHLAKALHRANHKIECIFSRTRHSAASLANIIESAYTTDISKLPLGSDLYIIAVPDDVIGSLIPEIPAPLSGIVHTAGSMDKEILRDLSDNHGILYPLQSFSPDKEIEFKTIPIYLEASNHYFLDQLKIFASSISGHIRMVSETQRKILHLSAVISCNFTNHLFTMSKSLLEENKMDFNDLKHLISETVNKSLELGPENTQTGPAIRNDSNTIQQHIGMLKKYEKRQKHINSSAIYELLSNEIIHYYKKSTKK